MKTSYFRVSLRPFQQLRIPLILKLQFVLKSCSRLIFATVELKKPANKTDSISRYEINPKYEIPKIREHYVKTVKVSENKV